MSEDTAIKLAIEAIEAQIKTLAIDADLCDIWSIPQPTELIVENFRTPAGSPLRRGASNSGLPSPRCGRCTPPGVRWNWR